MPKSADALVEPEMLVWARESARLNTSIAAKKAGVPEERLRAWESGEGRPTVKQLRKLARVYGQSFAAFYLSVPPKDYVPKLTDYRRLPGGVLAELSYELLLEFRAAIDRRTIALELLGLEGTEPPSVGLDANPADDPEVVGWSIREHLGISLSDQTSWRENRIAFTAWREAAEGAGILVFQARRIDVQEMRGLSISEHPLPVVVVNRKDAYAGRIFSLLHELVHLSLHVNSVCDLATAPGPREEHQLEVFCNHVAGAAIAPRSALMQYLDISTAGRPREWSDAELAQLAKRFCTSREVILRRLLTLHLTTRSFYEFKRQQYAEELESWSAGKGFLLPPADVLSAAGKPFVRLVLSALNADRITASDVADYLGVRLKHLPALSEDVGA